MENLPKKKKSRAALGNYYKLKTKKWFKDQGYFCEYLERNQRLFLPGKIIFIKKDLAGADGISMNGKEIIFWQAKLTNHNISEAIKEFNNYPYPPFVERWVIVWTKGGRKPEITKV